MGSAVSHIRNRCHIRDLTVLFFFRLVTPNWVFWITLTRDRSCTPSVGNKKELHLLQAGWGGAKSGAVVVEPFGQSMRGSLVCWGWQIPSIRVGACLYTSEEKKKRLCELHKVVSTCGLDGLRIRELTNVFWFKWVFEHEKHVRLCGPCPYGFY